MIDISPMVLIFFHGQCVYYYTIQLFSVWLKSGFNPTKMFLIQYHTKNLNRYFILNFEFSNARPYERFYVVGVK